MVIDFMTAYVAKKPALSAGFLVLTEQIY